MSRDRIAKGPRSSFTPVRRAPRRSGTGADGVVLRMIQCSSDGPGIQIGPSADRFEREADQVADRVVRRKAESSGASATSRKDGEGVQRLSSIHEDEEPNGGGLQLKASEGEEAEEVQRKGSDPGGKARMENAADKAIQSRGGGESLDPSVRGAIESEVGADLGNVRVHRGASAHEAASALRAKAFTHKNDIWLGAGQSPRDLGLLAHESAHVVQQGAAGGPPKVRRAPEEQLQNKTKPQPDGAPKGKNEETVAPQTVELKGNPDFKLGAKNEEWFAKRKQGTVRARFGELASGPLNVRKSGDKYEFARQSLPLTSHPLFRGWSDAKLRPVLALRLKRGQLTGYLGVQAGKRAPSANALQEQFADHLELLGLQGFSLPGKMSLTNKLEGGKLVLALTEAPIKLGRIFEGSFTLRADDEKVTSFAGTVSVSVDGLANGNLELKRDEKGLVTGKADIAVTLAKANLDGNVTIAWDGYAVDGTGKIGYQGEKLSGSVTLRMMERGAAEQLESQKAPPKGATKKGKSRGKRGKAKQDDYVLFGEGDLNFTFTDWLTGTAHVVVDHKGYTTIVGKITPQKEFELFPQKDYHKQLFKVEVRATYGLPVVGNVFIFGNVNLSAFANVGPAKFHQIEVAGTYSNDPKKKNDFSIRGTLNVSAAAGLDLRGEAGAGIEILAHDIKAGAGVTAKAGVRGYTEATPIIGYREKGKEGEDNKGEFFLRGEFEMAAQPFLGLGGDLFVEVDAPWWSPVPDKRWTWPLGNKEYPLGGEFGIGATVDYVFGSGKAPAIDFKPVEFSADKFLTDLYSDKAKGKSGDKKNKGTWKEKNQKSADAPKGGKQGNASQGEPPAPKAAKAKAPGGKQKGRSATPNAKTAEGEKVAELKRKAAAKGKQPKGKDASGGKPGKKGEEKPDEKERERNKQLASVAVEQAMAKGIRKSELRALLAKLKKKYGLKEVSLNKQDDVILKNSEPELIEGKKYNIGPKGKLNDDDKYDAKTKHARGKKKSGTFQADSRNYDTLKGALAPHFGKSGGLKASDFPYRDMPDKAERPEKVTATLHRLDSFSDDAREGENTGHVGHFGNLEASFKSGEKKADYQGGHLIANRFAGPDTFDNLVPQRGKRINNKLYKKLEELIAKNLDKPGVTDPMVALTLTPKYPEKVLSVNLRAIAESLTGKSGKQVQESEGRAIQTVDAPDFESLRSGKKYAVATWFNANTVLELSRTATLENMGGAVLWTITDHKKSKAYVLKIVGNKMKIYSSKEPGYIAIKKTAAKDTKATIQVPARIPSSIAAEIEISGVNDPSVPDKKVSGEGGDVMTRQALDYYVVSQNGPDVRIAKAKGEKLMAKDPQAVKLKTTLEIKMM